MAISLTRKRHDGFTMIELMLVVIIIGMLAAVMVPRLAGKKTKAMRARAKAEVASLTTAVDSFELDVGRFPTTDEGLDALMVKPPSLSENVGWDGPYMREIIPDPWGNPYQYRCPGQFTVDYDLWSYGEDGQDGGEDDIRNVQGLNSSL